MEPIRSWSLKDMLEIKGKHFYAAFAGMNQMLGLVSGYEARRSEMSRALTIEHVASLRELCGTLHENLKDLGAEVTAMAVASLSKQCNKSITYADFLRSVSQIDDTLANEMELVKLFVLDRDTQKYYAITSFCDEVGDKFPACSYEIEEAAKCLALGRTTAAVFHLMRTMEVCMRAIYQCLGLAPLGKHEKSWGTLLGRIKTNIDDRGKSWAERDSFQSLYERLEAIRHAQRNNTMHVEDKYTAEEARLVFDNTKLFMTKIASRMDQDGKPLA